MRTKNQFTLRGYVGNVKPFDSNMKVSIATNRSYKDGDEWKTATEWNEVTIWSENVIDYIARNVGSGDLVEVEARVAQRSYPKNGETIYTTDITVEKFTLLAKKAEQEEEQEEEQPRKRAGGRK